MSLNHCIIFPYPSQYHFVFVFAYKQIFVEYSSRPLIFLFTQTFQVSDRWYISRTFFISSTSLGLFFNYIHSCIALPPKKSFIWTLPFAVIRQCPKLICHFASVRLPFILPEDHFHTFSTVGKDWFTRV